jgi:hypothetical protein
MSAASDDFQVWFDALTRPAPGAANAGRPPESVYPGAQDGAQDGGSARERRGLYGSGYGPAESAARRRGLFGIGQGADRDRSVMDYGSERGHGFYGR